MPHCHVFGFLVCFNKLRRLSDQVGLPDACVSLSVSTQHAEASSRVALVLGENRKVRIDDLEGHERPRGAPQPR